MNAFLISVKADLLDVRLRLAVLVLALALVAALAYAVLGGGASSTPPPSAPISVPTGAAGLAIEAPSAPNEAVSETTNASSSYAHAPWRNPFIPLPEQKAQAASTAPKQTTSAQAASSSSGSESSSSSSNSSSSASQPAAPKPSTPAKHVYIHYHVTAQFGPIPATPTGTSAPKLKTYPDMALNEPLPDKNNAQLLFAGVVLKTGDQAVFTLTGAAILHGSALCLPSATQCAAIELKPGQSETLEVVESSGASATYELRLISISKSTSTASIARARTASRRESHAEKRLVSDRRLEALPGLIASASAGAPASAR